MNCAKTASMSSLDEIPSLIMNLNLNLMDWNLIQLSMQEPGHLGFLLHLEVMMMMLIAIR